MSNIFVARQPIYDTNRLVVASELLFRPMDDDDQFEEDRATARVMMSALVDLDFEAVSAGRPVLINMTRPFLTGEYTLPLNKDQVILEVLETVEVDDAVIDGVKRLSREGFHIALDDFELGLSTEQLLPYAQTVKLDVMNLSAEQLEAHVVHLRGLGKALLAEKVETMAHFEMCQTMGFDYYQGYFLSRPQMVAGRSVPAGLATGLQLLNELSQPDAELDEIEKLIQQDVGLSYRLLRYINSSFFARANKIGSIRQALVMMGLVEVRRWASLLTLAGVRSHPPELLRVALQRARMCELLGEAIGDADGARFFTIGLFSHLDVMLQVPMDEVLESLPLTEDFRAALQNGVGPCGEALGCCRAYEQTDVSQAQMQGLPFEAIRSAYLNSMVWADDIVSGLVSSANASPEAAAKSA
ncbi:MAG: HDOD domain-containing protein [Pseudomonadota bacterium]